MSKPCIRDEKGRFAKHDWQDTGDRWICTRCHIKGSMMRHALSRLYLPTLINTVTQNNPLAMLTGKKIAFKVRRITHAFE